MNNNTVLNRVFSLTSLNKFLKRQLSDCYVESIKRYVENIESKNNKELLSAIYVKLKNSYRNEYFYKNTLLNHLLMDNPNHNVYNSSILSEVPIANSIADFVFINGKAVVYEIKTELDNFEKLPSQIQNYYKAFKQVVVVTAEEKISKLKIALNEYESVGIYVLTRDNKIEFVKRPKNCLAFLDRMTMFKILRKKEIEALFLDFGISLPNVSDFEYFDACFDIFSNLELEHLYKVYLNVLKKRCTINKEKFLTVPKELKSMVYFSKMNENDFKKLDAFLYG